MYIKSLNLLHMCFVLTEYIYIVQCIYPNQNDVFQYPMQTYGYGILFSVSGYLGVSIVLTLVKSFGALVAVTGRHSLTILIVPSFAVSTFHLIQYCLIQYFG
jgi:hypothetical protein